MSRAAFSRGVASAASCSSVGLALAAGLKFPLDDGPPRLQRGFVGNVLRQVVAELDEVVGQQPGPGVPDLELDRLGAPGNLCLFAQRRQLPPDFAGEVAEPLQVGLHGLQLADGLFLAPPVLEDARGFLDEAAPVLGRGVQDLVQLALADDDVHLPAQARVGEQLLDVQQAAAGTVDGVFGAAGAEQRAGDGDFAVFDGQGAVGVVDGQGDVRPAQRRPAGRCRRR